MKKRLLFAVIIVLLSLAQILFAEDNMQTYDFSTENGNRVVRTVTPSNGQAEIVTERKTPIRNPHILAQVLWVDRNHENAIAENVSVTPDGSGAFAGWWLNHERFSAYATSGLETPIWAYRQNCDWQMPVSASDANYGGTGAPLPGYLWDHDSPLYSEQLNYDPGYNGTGVAFSGDGTLAAYTASMGSADAILIVYDMILGDTLFTRHFVPTNGQYGVDFSSDGSTIVVSNYGGLIVYNVPDGEVIGNIYNYSQNTAKISGDGSRIVIGTFNGSAFLHEWNGSQYQQVWSRSTGDDWVTAVDISTDGSTIVCGTLDFQNGQIAGGKFMQWDDAGNVLIDYDDYGDEVGGVAISGDGQYSIAGSWGQYGNTFGDVVTCFYRGVDTPIFQLLDDIDEPGSIFDVAISEDGGFAAAGGKAVHAREFGNGGMFYSIMIRDLLTNDVAVASINEPGEFVNPGEDVIPTATYINVGTADASFTARCVITDVDSGEEIYNSTYDMQDLGSFSTGIVYFSPHFSVPDEGRYRMEFSAEMENDEDLSNNNLDLILRSWHDIKAVEVNSPFDETTLNWPFSAIGTFKNLGSYYETADIQLDIYDEAENLVFSTISTVYDLGPYASEEVYFDSWIPEATGMFRAEFNVLLEGDRFPDDNMISKNFEVVNEMIYDDGEIDISIWVDIYPNSSNRKFAQLFEPNIDAPFTITGARVYIAPINYNGYLDYFTICRGTLNQPDTLDRVISIENPALPGPGAWMDLEINAPVTRTEPLWAIIHWPDRPDTGPYIGADNSGEMNHNSYWYADNNVWTMYSWADWMMRMTLQEGTGTTHELYSGLPSVISLSQNYPNPFNPSTRINFELPNDSRVKLEIFDILGNRVSIVADDNFEAGYHSVIWDGKNSAGDDAASGVYYYRLSTQDHRISRKMTLVR